MEKCIEKDCNKLLGSFLKDIQHNKISLPNVLVSAFYMYYDEWNRK